MDTHKDSSILFYEIEDNFVVKPQPVPEVIISKEERILSGSFGCDCGGTVEFRFDVNKGRTATGLICDKQYCDRSYTVRAERG